MFSSPPGGQFALAGWRPDVEDILITTVYDPWMTHLLHEENVRYLVIDRRWSADDVMRGYYFTPGPREQTRIKAPGVVQKFDRMRRVDRIFDSGDIVVYDVENLIDP